MQLFVDKSLTFNVVACQNGQSVTQPCFQPHDLPWPTSLRMVHSANNLYHRTTSCMQPFMAHIQACINHQTWHKTVNCPIGKTISVLKQLFSYHHCQFQIWCNPLVCEIWKKSTDWLSMLKFLRNWIYDCLHLNCRDKIWYLKHKQLTYPTAVGKHCSKSWLQSWVKQMTF